MEYIAVWALVVMMIVLSALAVAFVIVLALIVKDLWRD